TFGVAGDNDSVTVTGSNDTLSLTGSNDHLTLTGGIDTLAFSVAGYGNDVIAGFNPATDFVQFNPALFANYAAVAGAMSGSTDTTIAAIGSNDSVTLTGVAPGSLSNSN